MVISLELWHFINYSTYLLIVLFSFGYLSELMGQVQVRHLHL